jgi:hypothetical protein
LTPQLLCCSVFNNVKFVFVTTYFIKLNRNWYLKISWYRRINRNWINEYSVKNCKSIWALSLFALPNFIGTAHCFVDPTNSRLNFCHVGQFNSNVAQTNSSIIFIITTKIKNKFQILSSLNSRFLYPKKKISNYPPLQIQKKASIWKTPILSLLFQTIKKERTIIFFVSGWLHSIVGSHAFPFQEGCLVKTTLSLTLTAPSCFFQDTYTHIRFSISNIHIPKPSRYQINRIISSE